MLIILRTLIATLFLVGAASANAQGLDDPVFMDQEPGYPDAEGLLQAVRDRLPAAPLDVGARLQAKDRSGNVLRVLFAEMDLHWGAPAPWARYSLMDQFGKDLSSLTVRWPATGGRSFSFTRGDPAKEAPVPDLSGPVEGTDLSWLDLTLSFLWWTGGETVAAETRKGRFCYVLDVPAPPGEAQQYARVRLWIDPEVAVLLQADAYAENGDRVRSLKVKSFKKIDGIWTLKDLDVYTYPGQTKTTLRVQEVKGPAPPDNG